MNKTTLFSALIAFAGLSLFVSLFASGTHVSIIQWPVEALNGLAFTFAWGLGFPKILAYLAAILTLLSVTYACYSIGKKIAKLMWR